MRDRKCIWTLRGRAFILGEDVTNGLFWAHVVAFLCVKSMKLFKVDLSFRYMILLIVQWWEYRKLRKLRKLKILI